MSTILIILMLAQDDPDLRTFISPECCVTRGCCFEIKSSDIRDIGYGEVRILVTGEVMNAQRSGDGRYWRCACDFDTIKRKYFISVYAKTRCIFTPEQSS